MAGDIDSGPLVEIFPFKAGPLGDPWNVLPNPNGPSVSATDGFLQYRATHLPAPNQWAMVSMTRSFHRDHGCAVAFGLRANQIEGGECKFALGASDGGQEGRVILRFTQGGQQADYVYFDNGAFQELGSSSFRAMS